LWLLVGATGIRVPVGSPDLADREQAMMVVSSEVMTMQATAVGSLGRLSSTCGKGKNIADSSQ